MTVCAQRRAVGGRMQFCSDICKLDTAASKWSTGFLRPPFGEKAYHSATLVGADIWVIGGADDKHSSAQVHVLNTKTLKWRTVAFRQVKHCVIGSTYLDRS